MKIEEITSHEIACQILKRDPKALPDVSMRPEHQREAMIADAKLMDIAEAINKTDNNFKADYKNNQRKWFPVFDAAEGFVFSNSRYDYWYTCTACGSRLCFRFRSEEVSDFFGTQFNDLHRKSFNV